MFTSQTNPILNAFRYSRGSKIRNAKQYLYMVESDLVDLYDPDNSGHEEDHLLHAEKVLNKFLGVYR